MPFMAGKAPIRRTAKYLESGRILFREAVKIFTIHYNEKEKIHEGAREFDFWHMPQIQYKNPKVQCVTLKNLTPTPFIRIYLEDGKKVLIDLDSKEKEDILDHLANFTAVCRTETEIENLKKLSERKFNASYFGFECIRHCMCEVQGQVPCSYLAPVPYLWRGDETWGKVKKFRIPHAFMEPGLVPIRKENE